ncbi:MAG: hypothetical protein ACK502_07835 [Alphaproteobacteria bacterium]
MAELDRKWTLRTAGSDNVVIHINQKKGNNGADGDGFYMEVEGLIDPCLSKQEPSGGAICIGYETKNPALLNMMFLLQEKMQDIVAKAAHDTNVLQQISRLNPQGLPNFRLENYSRDSLFGAVSFNNGGFGTGRARKKFFENVARAIDVLIPELNAVIQKDSKLQPDPANPDHVQAAVQRYNDTAMDSAQSLTRILNLRAQRENGGKQIG